MFPLDEGKTVFSEKKCVITGGAGFIGSHLARRLVGFGARVEIVDRMIPEYGGNDANIADIAGSIHFCQMDIRNRMALREVLDSVDYVFNLAGQTSHMDSMTDPWTDLEINAYAQLDLLESVRHVCPEARVIFASTRQVYGRPHYLPVDETHPVRPVDVNGINKIAGESYHLLYGEVYGLNVSVLRLTNTYGPGMRVKDARQTFLGTWIKSAIDGTVFQIFGDGSQRRDFNYVDDVVDAFLLAATREDALGSILNLGSDEVISLAELAELLRGLAPDSHYELVAFPAERKAIDIGDYYSDWKRAAEVLQWAPEVSLAEGLAKTLGYFAKHKSLYW